MSNNYIDIQFVDRFLSAVFIAYPEYYFDATGTLVTLNNANYTLSPGVCSYGEGSTIDIYVSAWEQEVGKNTLYQWSSNNYVITAGVGEKEDVMSFGDLYTYSPGGSSIVLSVYDDDFPTDMVPYYYNDINVRVKYPNIQMSTISSDNSDLLFQNVRAVAYDDFTETVAPITQAGGTSNIIIQTSVELNFPTYSPVIETDGVYAWTLSATNWIDTIVVSTTVPNLTYTLIEGGGTVPGTIKFGDTVTLTIDVSGVITKIIPLMDFEANTQTFNSQVSTIVTGNFSPQLKIYTKSLNALVDEEILFENITQTATGSPVSGYLWDMGNGDSIINVSGTDTSLIPAIYTTTGLYTITVSSVNMLGLVSVQEFSDIITVVSTYPYYDDDVLRLYGTEGIAYPNLFDDIKIKPNEWVIDDNINSAFDKLNEDLEYLESISQKYVEPPTQYQGWLGQSIYNETDIKWHVPIPNINSQVNSPENIVDNSRDLNNIKDVSIFNDNIYMVTDTMIYVASSDYNATEISSRTYKNVGNPFYGIESFGINSEGKIYVLDALTQDISVFDNYEENGWKYLFSWGKYGGISSLEGFKTPVDLYIDLNDNVWITDSGNNVVKKYTKNGSWLMTLKYNGFNNIISTTIDDNNNIHVLTSSNVLKFTPLGIFISSYSFRNINDTPTKIIKSQDGFIYVCFDKSITKFNRDGVYAGIFGNTFSNVNYNSLYHDTNRRLFVTNTNSILKFFEMVKIDSVVSNNTTYAWDINDIYINKNEYVQDFVYNRSFSRMWDNLDIAKRSLFGTIYEYTDYLKNKKNVIVGLTTRQYNNLLQLENKDDIFIGVNEIVTADSINRCLFALYEMLELLLSFQTESIIATESATVDIITPVTLIKWRWVDVASTGINPFTWEQVGSTGFYSTEWRYAKTGVTAP